MSNQNPREPMYHVVSRMFPEVIHFQVAVVWCGATIPPFLEEKI
jgi:hypothetical protein